jgi:hypothetical protein
MNAPQMLAHLCDQMRHTLGDAHAEPRRTIWSWPPFKQLGLYVLPWPAGKLRGPWEAFVSRPNTWGADLNQFFGMVDRFVAEERRTTWPGHAIFGAMNRRSWGFFCHKHFDHHLRQFGA